MSTNASFSMTPMLSPEQWNSDKTFYQILLIKPDGDSPQGKNIKTELTVQTRGSFKGFPLDGKTKKNLKKYPVSDDSSKRKTIGSYLPSLGSCFEDGFMKVLFKDIPDSNSLYQIELNNFYDVLRTLLHTRKMSQLIAKTWDARLKAQKNGVWSHFTGGSWDKISDSKILDGLIARDLFLLASSSEPDDFSLDVYSYPPKDATGLLVLPTSKAWQGIALSLLMAGQVYYRCDKNGNFVKESDVDEKNKFYHQVSQPILSTGEIVTKYALDVSYGMYKGIIEELDLRSNKFSPAYLATLPYPAIPSPVNLKRTDITKWAKADDVKGDFPFYETDEAGKFSIGAKHHTPPFPYLPSSCC